MAFGLTERFDALLSELMDLLPQKFLGHYQKERRGGFLKTYKEKHLGSFWKMKLVDTTKAQSINATESSDIIRLNQGHADELEKMYNSTYPGVYFDRRMLATGKYFGYVDSERIVSAAGVTVNSEEYGVSVLGSIATLPKFRGKGLATLVTARLLQELIGKRDLITLSVKKENAAAVRCYSNLGFEKTHECEEGYFTRKM